VALGISRKSYYYDPKSEERDEKLVNVIKEIFIKNRRCYGQKKLYKALRRNGISISKDRLVRIIKEENLVSKYVLRRKPRSENKQNSDEIGDRVNRNFTNKKPLEVVVSDLTYVDVNKKWHYICLLIELSHREIIGFSAGKSKDAELVTNAWLSIKSDIRNICYFHTDRGGEFKNEEIDKILAVGDIKRSLSRPGTPIDNAVAESMYDIIKTEFIYGEKFNDLDDLQTKLSGFVWWYNNERLHSSLGYIPPVESRKINEIGVTSDKMANKSYQKFWKKISVHNQKIKIEKESYL
jgi:putative transposase